MRRLRRFWPMLRGQFRSINASSPVQDDKRFCVSWKFADSPRLAELGTTAAPTIFSAHDIKPFCMSRGIRSEDTAALKEELRRPRQFARN